MRYQRLIAAALIFVLTANSNTALAVGQKEVKLYWNELPNAILHEKIAVNLPDGTRVEGQVRAVQTDSVRLTVQKTGDAGRHPKGPMVISKSSLSSFELHARRPHDSNTDLRSGQEAGATIGALGGLVLGAAVARHNEGRFYAVFIGSMLTGMALGGLVAIQTDTEIVHVQIIPEPSVVPSAVTPSAGTANNLQQTDSGLLPPNKGAAPTEHGVSQDEDSVLLVPSRTGKKLIRRTTHPNAAADSEKDGGLESWPVVPDRSRNSYAY